MIPEPRMPPIDATDTIDDTYPSTRTDASDPSGMSDSLIDLDRVFLPAGSMRQLERITRLTDTTIAGEVEIGRDHWVYDLHFPGDPIFPGCLMIEAAGQLVAAKAWSEEPDGRPRLARATAEFRGPAGPGDEILELEASIRRRRHLHFGEVSVTAAGRPVASIDVVLAVLPLED